jgi:hypothetical protein
MADNLTTTATVSTVPVATVIATDDAGAGGHVQRVKLSLSADGSAAPITADADGLLVNLGTNNDVTVTGTVTATLVAGGDVDVLTVPAPLSTTGGGTEATALRVTIATDSTGVLSVDDNGGVLTVDGTVTAAAQPGVDIGDVTVNNAAGAAAVNIQDGGNAITVDGTVTVGSITAGDNNIGNVDVVTMPIVAVTQSGTWDEVGINDSGNAITVDWAGTAPPIGAGVEATALRVTLATDSTGLVSIDDGGGTLTVDAPVGTPAFVRLSDGAAAITTLAVSLATVPSHAVTIDAGAVTSLALIDDPVFADEAAFTVTSSKVMASGNLAVSSSAAPDSTGAGTAVIGIANRNRVPFVIGGDPGVITVKHTTITTAVADAAIVTIATANKIVVTRISVTLDNASTVFPTLLIGFGTATTPTTTGVLVAHGGVPAGGGITVGDGSGILGVGADNEDLRVTTTGNATGNGLQIVVTYYLIVA